MLMDQDANLKPSGNNSFELELKASPSFVGVEESVYRVYREPGQNSEEIRLVSARSNIEGKWEETASSKFDFFSFDPGINKFRLFYLNWDGTETKKSILLGAHNEIVMEKATHQIMQNQASCSSMSIGVQCFVLPQGVALNPLISVLVNQQEKLVPVGLTLRMLIQDEIRQPLTTVLSTLTVRKKFRNQLTDISFPKGSMEILKLPLQGGEQIRW